MNFPRWNDSSGLVSLLEIMKVFSPSKIYRLAADLAYLGKATSDLRGALRKRDTRDSLNSLLESRAECEQIGLNLSIIALDRIVVALKEAKTDWATINQSADELHERIQDELDTILFMHIPTERAEFYRAPFKRWGDAINRFPKTLNDVEEAGKCLACARGTAYVFHLMRIMETALRTLANDLGIPYAPNWESYLAG